MFYLQAKVKGAQSSSLGLESPDPLERALFPVETRFSFHLAPHRNQAGLGLHRGRANSAQECLTSMPTFPDHKLGRVDRRVCVDL